MTEDRFARSVQGFLAVTITIGFFAVIGALMYSPAAVNPAVKDILLVMLGALLAAFKEITSYYLGSSSGSASKDRTNAALTAQLIPEIPAKPKDPPA